MEKELTKSVGKKYFVCRKCAQKLSIIDLSSSSDIFSVFSKQSAMYCENKECDEFGYLTVVGIKKEE